jgi:hypothetical protein
MSETITLSHQEWVNRVELRATSQEQEVAHLKQQVVVLERAIVELADMLRAQIDDATETIREFFRGGAKPDEPRLN